MRMGLCVRMIFLTVRDRLVSMFAKSVKIYFLKFTISSQGKQDFIDECLSNDDLFTLDDWVDFETMKEFLIFFMLGML